MKLKVALSIVLVLLVAAESFAIQNIEGMLLLKKYTGYDCNSYKECLDTVKTANPFDRNFTVYVPSTNGAPCVTFAKVLRDKFGSKVFIDFWADLSKDPALKKEDTTLFYVKIRTDPSSTSFFNPNNTAPGKLVMNATAFNATLEKTFTAEYTGSNRTEAMHDVYKKLATQIADWLGNELDLQKKVQQKNAEPQGK